MTLEKHPFQATRLEEDREDRDQVTVSLSPELRVVVDRVKQALNIKSDPKAVRLLIEAGENVIFGCFSANTWRYLSDKERVRLSDSERLKPLV